MFTRSLFSIIAMIIFAIILMLILLIKNISNHSREEEMRLLTNKMYVIAEDMDNQLENLSTITVQIANSVEFRLERIFQNKYYEKEMAEQLKKYKSFTGISEKYFVMYRSYDRLFTSDGTTMFLDNYLSKKLYLEDRVGLQEMIKEVCQKKEKGFFVYQEGDYSFFLYPMHTYGVGNNQSRGVIGFIVSSDSIEDRVRTIVGSTYGDMCIYYKDFCLMGNEEVKSESDLMLNGNESKFQIYVRMDEKNYFSIRNVFSNNEIIIIVSIVFILSLLGFVISWWNYLPFWKIQKKYSFMITGQRKNDWDDLDYWIESLLHEKRINSDLINEQYKILREQVVHHIIFEGYSEHIKKYIAMLNINLNFPTFGIIKVKLREGEELEDRKRVLQHNIDLLAGNRTEMYYGWECETDMQILVASNEDCEIIETVEVLSVVLDELELNVKVELRTIFHDLNKLPFMKSDEDSEKSQVVEDAENNGDLIRKDNTVITQAVEYIEQHFSDFDLSLEKIAEMVQLTPQYLSAKFKQEVGISYKEYLTKLRIEEAKRLLKEESISVSDICQKVGWVHVPNFIKIFQKNTGVTPLKYRMECQERKNGGNHKGE